MSSESDQVPNIIVSYPAIVRAEMAVLRSLMSMLVRKKVLTLEEIEAIFTEAIERCHAEDEPSGPNEQLSTAEAAAALLALRRQQVRQSLGGKS